MWRGRAGARGTPNARRACSTGIWLVLLAALALLGTTLPLYWVFLMSTVAVGAIVARGIGLVTNEAGMITLCQMSFAAIGGWVVSWLALTWPEAPFLVLVLAGGIVAAPVGLLLGLVTARIRGVEFAVVTLGFAAALDLVLRQGGFPGVGRGTAVIPAGPFDDPRLFFALSWGLLIALQLLVWALGRTAHGLSWLTVRASERAAAAIGIRIGWSKATAFATGALFSGIAGGLLAGQYGLLTTSVFTPLTSMVHLATAVLCGASLFSGALLAGLFGVFVPEVLRRIGLPLDIANALLALGAFDVLRRGNGGIAEQLRSSFQERAFRDARTTCRIDATAPADLTARAGDLRREAPDLAVGAPEPSLAITGLSVRFGGNPALAGVDLTLRAGEVHALIGPNGAGKSTLVDAVTGFLPGYDGTVCLDGAPLDGISARMRARRGVRRSFQQSHAVTSITVGDYLRVAAPASSAEERETVRGFFGLPDPDLPIRLLDVGSRRVLEIAAALTAGPRALLLDEPAAGLGEAEREFLAERLRQLPRAWDCTVLLIEHDMEFVRAAADRVTVLEEGRVIASGPVSETLDSPRVIAAYLGKETAR